MRALKIGLWLFFITILQLTTIGRLGILGKKPDLLLIFTVYFAISSGNLVGSLIGFFSGIAVELFSATPIGLEAFGKTIVGYWIGSLSKRLYINFLSTQLICNFLAVIGKELLILTMLTLNLKLPMFSIVELSKLKYLFLPEALINSALSPILFIFLSRIFGKIRGGSI